MRTYQFDKKGSEIQELLDQIKNKTIYGNATTETAGLMSAEDKDTLDTLVYNVGENIQQLNSLNQAVSENTAAIETNTDNIATNTNSITALNATTGNLGTRLDAAEETLDNIFQLDANNFMGIYDAAASLPAMTGAGWALVGTDLTTLNAYVYNLPQAQWQQYGNTTYDYSDYSGLAAQVATIGLEIDDIYSIIADEGETSYSLSESGYMSSNGTQYVTTTKGRHTESIPLSRYYTLNATINLSSAGCAIAFYDTNGNFLSNISILGSGTQTYTIDLTDATYSSAATAIVSTYNYNSDFSSYSVVCAAVGSLTERVANNEAAIAANAENISTTKEIAESNENSICDLNLKIGLNSAEYNAPINIAGYVHSSSGAIVDTTNAMMSALVDISGYRLIKYGSNISNAGAMLAFYDSSENYLPSLEVVGTARFVEGTLLIDESYSAAKYVRLSVYGSQFFDVAYLTLSNSYDNSINERLSALENGNEDVGELVLTSSDFTIDAYINVSGREIASTAYKATDYTLLKGAEKIVIFGTYSGESSVSICFYDSNKTKVGDTYNNIDARYTEYVVEDIPSDAVYFRCGSRASDISSNTYVKYSSLKNRLNELEENAALQNDRISNLESQEENPLLISTQSTKPKVLIFGDSISDCTTIGVDGTNIVTTSYVLRHPSNSYVNSNGQTIAYDMWPYFVNSILNCADCRCYAKSGASYRTLQRDSGNERQNLEYQIQLAINDLDNPNSVFPTTGAFVPDIVIFALGTNDGSPDANTETYETTMAKTIYSSGTTIDADATIAALDKTNRADAVRYAFMTIKKYFPYALTFVVLPIQRVNSEMVQSGTMNGLIKQIAERYSIHIIDGARDMGIVRDFASNVDIYLKDGLHPNDKGQNLYARLVLSAIRKEYIDLSLFN